MTRRRWVRRAFALSFVLGAVTLALAAVPAPKLVVNPPVIEVHQMLSSPGSGSGMIGNSGDASATVTAITPDGSCTGNGVTGFSSPMPPFTLNPSSGQMIGIGCTGSPTYGIRRCKQNVMGSSSIFTSYTGLCITEGTSIFNAVPSSVSFNNVPVSTMSQPQTVVIMTNMFTPPATSISVQIGDQDGNFQIGSPCTMPGPGCDATVAVAPMGAFSVTVFCTPQTTGPHVAPLHIVTTAGTHVSPAVTLMCNGTSSGTSPAISVNPTTTTLLRPINTSTPTTIHVSNIGMSDLHVMSIAQSGSPDWSYATSAGCPTLPCTLQPMTGGFDITAMFAPSAIGTRNATLEITSDDPNMPQVSVQLNGSGQGANIALATNLGMPATLDLGTTPIGVPTTATFDLRNDGNVVLDPVNLSLTQTGAAFAVSPAPTTIAAFGTREITVTCTPPAAMLYTGDLDITAPTAQSGSPIMIEVRCTGTAGSLFSTPSSLPFDEVRTGTVAVSKLVTLKTAGGPLTLSAPPKLVSAIPGVTVGPPTSLMITQQMPVMFEVTVDPGTMDRPLDGDIEVSSDTDTLTIPMTGKVVTAAIDAPEKVSIGSFCVGQPTTSSPVRLTASGTATIGLPTQPVLMGSSSSPFQVTYTTPVAYPYELPAGQTATVDITPLRQMTKSQQVDQIVWATDVDGMEQVRTTVTADFVAEGGAIAPQLLDFESVKVSQHAVARPIRIQNCGTQPMALSGPSIDPSGEFVDDSPNPLPEMLAPNQVATISISFAPRKIGLRTATLTVESSTGPLSVNLTGTGTGDPDSKVEPKSFYGCGCTTGGDPAAAWPALVVMFALRRRRRHR